MSETNRPPSVLRMAEEIYRLEDAERIAPLPGTTFRCAECQREVRTDHEVVTCAHGDDPTCDPCCEAYHGTSGVPHPVGGDECAEWAREKAISQGDEA